MSIKGTFDHGLGLSTEEERALGADRAVRLRTFRLVIVLANELRNRMDRMLEGDGLTTQQAALLTVVNAAGSPSFSEAAHALRTTHQNVKRLATTLERKGFLRILEDASDGRVRRLRTTLKNQRYWAARNPSDHSEVLSLFADLSREDAGELFRLLCKLSEGVARLEGARPRRTRKG